MYSKIKIDPTNFPEFKINGEQQILDNLAQVNIFIGSNNSGKSRFIRRLFTNKDYSFSSIRIGTEEIGGIIDNIVEKFKLLPESTMKTGWSNAIRELNLSKNSHFTSLNERYLPLIEATKNIHNFNATLPQRREEFEPIKNLFEVGTTKLVELSKTKLGAEFQIYSFYLPILRGLRPLQISSTVTENPGETKFSAENDNLKERTKKDYLSQFKKDLDKNIYTGQDLYNDLKHLRNSNLQDRNKAENFEKFLSESFFHGQKLNIVANNKDDVVHVTIGNREDPIYNLGDGIQSIIILTYPLFFNQGQNCIFYFEEPEMHLHPGFQRIFIETLQRPEFSNYQYFITTHSNHFLDLTLDFENISVYTFEKKGNDEKSFTEIENVNSGSNNILQLIGARNSSVFLSNCTIWVEGITDRLYLKKYLDLFQENQTIKFKEDLHFSFVEYGGNNITHWSFLDDDDENHSNINVDRLCSKLFLISDKDGAGINPDGTINEDFKKKKNLRHKQLEANLKDRYYCLKCREIENLISKNVLKKTIVSCEKEPESIDFSKFDAANSETTPIGKLIQDTVIGIKRKYKAADSDSVRSKTEFCKNVIAQVHNYNDLTDEAKTICEKLYQFIKANNSSKGSA